MIIKASDKAWDSYLELLPIEKRDIYYQNQYCLMEQMQESGEAELFVFEDGDNIGIYPFIKRVISQSFFDAEYYDIETPYGYGGPVVKYEDSVFQKKFEEAFMEYCAKENIVAEFVRFHPLLKNETIFCNNIEVLHNRTTVWLDLTKDIEQIWMEEIATQNRNIIRKCEKNQLYVEISEDYDSFIEIYQETMQKVGAEDFYFFDKAYYEHMKNQKEYVLMTVKCGTETIAAAIFMGYGEYFHYHLSGSRRAFLKLSPNNLLLWEAIRYAKKKGYKKMHFGGGLTDSTEDNLYRFKKKFSSECCDFYIGKRVHNQKVYQKLIQDWEERHNQRARLLLQYRF